jgi:hypothetical protein
MIVAGDMAIAFKKPASETFAIPLLKSDTVTVLRAKTSHTIAIVVASAVVTATVESAFLVSATQTISIADLQGNTINFLTAEAPAATISVPVSVAIPATPAVSIIISSIFPTIIIITSQCIRLCDLAKTQ